MFVIFGSFCEASIELVVGIITLGVKRKLAMETLSLKIILTFVTGSAKFMSSLDMKLITCLVSCLVSHLLEILRVK